MVGLRSCDRFCSEQHRDHAGVLYDIHRSEISDISAVAVESFGEIRRAGADSPSCLAEGSGLSRGLLPAIMPQQNLMKLRRPREDGAPAVITPDNAIENPGEQPAPSSEEQGHARHQKSALKDSPKTRLPVPESVSQFTGELQLLNITGDDS